MKFSRNGIKAFALFAMLLNHFARGFLPYGSAAYKVCTYTGYFTAITMIYFLVEGYSHTKNVKKYALRLFLCGVLSQIPYSLYFGDDEIMPNMMFTLFLCLCLCALYHRAGNNGLKTAGIALVFGACMFCDWSIMAPFFTLTFLYAGDGTIKKETAFAMNTAFYALMFFLFSQKGAFSPADAVFRILPLVFAAYILLYRYDGSKHSQSNFVKRAFYLFYPAHLTVLLFMKTLIK